MSEQRVIITENGRSGSVIYQNAGSSISGFWEFAGSDAIALVHMGDLSDRNVLRFVADEVIRQKCPGCIADIDEKSGWITIHR